MLPFSRPQDETDFEVFILTFVKSNEMGLGNNLLLITTDLRKYLIILIININYSLIILIITINNWLKGQFQL